jgi:hypothetical protein
MEILTVGVSFKKILLLQHLHFPRNPALGVLLDPAVILPEVFVHRAIKRSGPDFPLPYKKIKSFPVTESAERGKLIRDS